MALHNFTVDHGLGEDDEDDYDSEEEVQDEDEEVEVSDSAKDNNGGGRQIDEAGDEDVNMNALRDEIANHCMHVVSHRRGRLW